MRGQTYLRRDSDLHHNKMSVMQKIAEKPTYEFVWYEMWTKLTKKTLLENTKDLKEIFNQKLVDVHSLNKNLVKLVRNLYAENAKLTADTKSLLDHNKNLADLVNKLNAQNAKLKAENKDLKDGLSV